MIAMEVKKQVEKARERMISQVQKGMMSTIKDVRGDTEKKTRGA